MLLLTIDRKAYMVSPMTPSLLTLSDIERSKLRPLRFQSLISRKGAELGCYELGPMLLLEQSFKKCKIGNFAKCTQ